MKKSTLFRFAILFATSIVYAVATPAQSIQVGSVEELYAAVNDPANVGATLALAPGVYMLSANDSSNTPRPNGGRLELQENMSIIGVEGDRDAVVIDGINLPESSYWVADGVAGIRTGRGHNAIEWLTARSCIFGTANIDTSLQFPGTAYVRVAHVASTDGNRGLDVRNNALLGASGETIEVDVVDCDFYDNDRSFPNIGIRVVNDWTTASTINVRMIGNRSWGTHTEGRVLANYEAHGSVINVYSAGNRFFGNGEGTIVLGGYSGSPAVSSGNTINLEAHGDQYLNNGYPWDPDWTGGLNIYGAENDSTMANVVNDNTVNVSLWGCKFANNLTFDLRAVGARSVPAILPPGRNNHVTVEVHGGLAKGKWDPVEFYADSLPGDPSLNNSVTVIRK